MREPPENKYRHLVVKGSASASPFTAHSGRGGDKLEIPKLQRQQHGRALARQLGLLKVISQEVVASQRAQEVTESGLGMQIQFVSQPNVELAFQSLSQERSKDRRNNIELLSVHRENELVFANVFVPDGKLGHFEKYISDYLGEKNKDHRLLIDTIATIRATELRTLWTDAPEAFPQNPDDAIWWEVWLPVRGHRAAVVADFRKLAALAGCQLRDGEANFPERTVLLMFGSARQFTSSVLTLNCVAEVRRAKETADFFDQMGVEEQRDWQDDILRRSTFAPDRNNPPYICLLDSGVNRGHPLLSSSLAEDDMHTLDRTGETDDVANHGTGMAGLALYGDLTEVLAAPHGVNVEHRLESVRLVEQQGANPGSGELHAQLFADAVARPEIDHPKRLRIFCSAVSATDYRDRGRPSSWSATVDKLSADYDGEGAFPRLFILAAGNTASIQAWGEYPASLSTNLIHDPGQAWNALTVGAHTHKVDTDDPAFEAVAPEGGLSPYTSTSATWDSAWPLKPDVVMEGGNVGKDVVGPISMSSLHLLSTHNRPQERLLTTFNATSAAAALCAKMAAEIASVYPNLRPETIRALIVHSAEWTENMRSSYLPHEGATKADYAGLIRHCGWGEPELGRALWSAGNSLTLVVEDVVHPYKKEDGKVESRDMNLHKLPWPREQLEALQNAQVQMRVTLSYFVEPNPSARGTGSKYYYPSHRLRFDVQRPLDATTEDFVARINAAAIRIEEGGAANPADPNWLLGDRQRHRGSLHQDVWHGTAADLASRGYLAVYPAAGWWRTRTAQERYNLPARYSLIISIRTEAQDVDLYTAVAQTVAI